MAYERKTGTCVCCTKTAVLRGRNLCGSCYWRHWKAKTLDQFPLVGVHRDGMSLAEVLKLTGITYRQLDHWIRQGYLQVDHPGGSGVCRHWTPELVEIASKMGRLAAAGVPIGKAVRIARGETDLIAPGIRVEVT